MGRKTGKIVNFSTYSGYVYTSNNTDKTKPKKQKRKEKQRKEKRKVISGKFVVFILLLISLICVCLFTPVFNITHISVKFNGIENFDVIPISSTDNIEQEDENDAVQENIVKPINSVPYTNQEIINMSEVVIGTNIFRTNLNSAVQKILKAPYVKNVNISRKLPSTLVIDVEQRHIKAYVDYVGSYMCIDETGYCVDSIQKQDKSSGIPIIIGLSPKDMVKGFIIGEILDVDDPVKIQKYANLLELLSKNELALNILTIDLTDKENTIITIDDGNKIIEVGNMENINAKIPYLKKILETEERNGTIYMNKTNDPIFAEKVGE